MRETEESRSIKLEAIRDKLESATISLEESKRLLKLQNHLEHRRFLFRRTKLNMAISLVCIVCVAIAGVLAYSPSTSVTSSNLVVLNGSGKLMNYDGTGINIDNLDDVLFVGLADSQVLMYNAFTGLWQNADLSVVGNVYSFSNLTDCSFVGLADGNIPFYNTTTSKWENQQPFTVGWNTTVNQLISLSSIAWSQITSGDATINSLIATYLSSNPIAYSSLTGSPSRQGSYSFLIRPYTNATNTYYQAINGTDNQVLEDWTSTDAGIIANNAISATVTNNGGGFVDFSSGNFYVNTSIQMRGNVTLNGQGMYSTKIISIANSNLTVFIWNPQAYEWFAGIQNLQIWGNRSANSAGDGIALYGHSYDLIGSNVWILNTAGAGVHYFSNSSLWGNKWYHLIIEDSATHGLWSQTANNEGYFEGCRFSDNKGNGCYGYFRDTSFVGCQFDTNNGDGINIAGEYNTQIIGGVVTGNNNGSGIVMACTYGHIDGVYLNQNKYGISVSGTQNAIGSCTYYGNTGGTIVDTGTDTQIDSGNTISKTAGENIAAGDVLFYNNSGYFKANALSSATLPTVGAVGVAKETVNSGVSCLIAVAGQITVGGWNWNVALPLWVSNSTFGGIQQTYPSNSGAQSQIIGKAISTTTILINPKSVISIP